jgi:hypothetical protein
MTVLEGIISVIGVILFIFGRSSVKLQLRQTAIDPDDPVPISSSLRTRCNCDWK